MVAEIQGRVGVLSAVYMNAMYSFIHCVVLSPRLSAIQDYQECQVIY